MLRCSCESLLLWTFHPVAALPIQLTKCSENGAFSNITSLPVSARLCGHREYFHPILLLWALRPTDKWNPDNAFWFRINSTHKFAFFGFAIGFGLAAIGAIALNLLLLFKRVSVMNKSDNKEDLSGEQPPPIANASPLGTALLAGENSRARVRTAGRADVCCSRGLHQVWWHCEENPQCRF